MSICKTARKGVNTMKTMNNFDKHKQRAEITARRDYKRGLSCGPGRYGALPKSAWASWYNKAFKEVSA